MTVTGQPPVNYTWDNANRLTGITQGSVSVGFAYDAANRRTQLVLPNGVAVAYTYDQDSHVTGITWTLGEAPVGDLEYSYDADGRVLAKSGSFARTGLPQAVSGNTFDAANQMTAFNGVGLSYDANGNLTSDGTNTYAWDARNQLAAINGGASSFAYDALGRRVAKSVGANVTQMLYDGVNPVQELSAAGTPTANLLTGLRIDEYFNRSDASGTMSFLADALGSTLALTDATGALQTQYTYEPFGNTTVGGPANANPVQFTGRANDGTGLYFYRARYYSPTFQRFIAQDPLDFAGGNANIYAYVLNDPIDLSDPYGLLCWGIVFRVSGAVILARVGFAIGTDLGVVLGSGAGTLIGGPVGFFPGAMAGGLAGGGIGFAGGWAAGRAIGGAIARLFEPSCCGQLNCDPLDDNPPQPKACRG